MRTKSDFNAAVTAFVLFVVIDAIKCEAFAQTATASPLVLTMTASPDPVRPGGQINYVMSVVNRGGTDLTGVKLRQVMPAYMVRISGFDGLWESWSNRSQDNYLDSGEIVTWNLGTLPAGQSRSVVLGVHLASGLSAPPNNTTIASSAEVSSSSGVGTSASTSVIVNASPALVLSMQADRSPAMPGETLTYTLKYGNPGSVPVSGVALRAQVPSGTTFTSANSGGILSGSEVRWDLGQLSAGASGGRSFTVTVNAGVSDGTVLAGHADVGSGEGRAETVTVVQNKPGLALSVVASPDPVRPGGQINYVMTVVNRSSTNLSGVMLRQVMPAYMVRISGFDGLWESWSNRSQDNYLDSGDIVTWNLGTLPAGQSRSVVLGVHLASGLSAPPNNTTIASSAEVSSSSGVGTSASTSVIVNASPALVLSMQADRSPAMPGETLTYTLKYGNPGSVPVSGVALRAQVPSGTTFASANSGGILSGSEVRWDLSQLSAGASGQRSFTVTVDAGVSDGTVLAGHADVGSGEGRAETVTVVQTKPGLALSVVASPDPVRPGGQINYVMSVVNRGGTDLTGVKLRQVMPAYMVPISGFDGLWESWSNRSQDNYLDSGDIVTWNLGTLPAGQSRFVTISAQVVGRTVVTSDPTDGTLIQSVAEVTVNGGVGAGSQATVRVGYNWPFLAVIPERVVAEGKLLTFVVTATDADLPNQTLTFGLDPAATLGATIDSRTGMFSWTPTRAQSPSTNSIIVRVTDSSPQRLSHTRTFTVIVIEANDPPVIAAIQNQVVNEGSALTFAVVVTDADLPQQTLTFALEAGSPTGASIDPATGIFKWTPTEPQGPSTNIITVKVTDNGVPPLSDTNSFTVIVNEVNSAPILTVPATVSAPYLRDSVSDGADKLPLERRTA